MDTTGPKPTEQELAYLAGFFDGEGCVCVSKNGSPRLSISNTYPFVLDRYVRAFGGGVYTKGKRLLRCRSGFQWSVRGPAALDAAAALVPFTEEKSHQLRALLVWSSFPPHSRQRAHYKQRITQLKRVDYGDYHPAH